MPSNDSGINDQDLALESAQSRKGSSKKATHPEGIDSLSHIQN
ncbi:MAG: hypothetical protein AAGL17_00680 [Cyanobacteria bacterium J06576_12]